MLLPVALVAGAGPSEAWRSHPEGPYTLARLSDGAPATWVPCRTVTWAVNPTGAPAGGPEDVREAVRRTAAATGLVFVEARPTHLVPQRSWLQPGGWPTGAPDLVVSWALPAGGQPPGAGSDLLEADGTAGVGGWSAEYVAGGGPGSAGKPGAGEAPGPAGGHASEPAGDAVAHITGGYVVLNPTLDARFTPGFTAAGSALLGSRRAPRGRLLLHELGHAVGLGHVADGAQVMHDRVQASNAAWGPGDLAGLRALRGGVSCPGAPGGLQQVMAPSASVRGHGPAEPGEHR